MANKQGGYKRRQWKKEGGQTLSPIDNGNIGGKIKNWAKNRKRSQRRQG
jgi:hypothetical protein